MPHPQGERQNEAEAELFRLLVENVQDHAVVGLDPQGRVQTWNAGAERLLGYREEEIIGQSGEIFFTPEDIQAGVPQQEMQEALQGGRGPDDRWHVRKDGSRFWSGGMMTPLRDEGGKLRGFAKIIRDRTEWKRQEEALKESEERHRAIADLTSDFATICRVDEDGSITVESVTEGFQKATGYSLEEMNAQGGWRILVWPDDLHVVQQSIHHWLSGRDHSSEVRIVTKRGETRWFTYLGRAARDPQQGRVTRLYTAAQDITERKQAHERLLEQQEWLRVTLASIGDAVIATDTQGRVTFLNGVAEELTGWTQLDAQGRPLKTVFHILNEQSRQPVQNPVDKVLREGTIVGLANHTVLIGRNGIERPIDDSAAPIRDGAGNLIGVVLVFRDVTEQRHAERMLQEREQQLRLVTDHAPVLLVHCDREARFKFVNKRYADRLGLAPQKIVGRHIPDVIGERAYASFREYIEATSTGRQVEFEVEIPYEQIGPRVMHCACAPDVDPNGQVRGFVAALSDVTERKRAEDALRESERRFRSLSACSPVGIFTTDTEGHCTYTNARCQTICGFTFQASLGEGWVSFVHPQDRQRAFEEWSAAARRGREFSGELRWRHRDGTVRWSLVRSAPMLTDQGQLLGHVGTVEDITERWEIEQALQESRERLDLALQAAELGQWELCLADHTASRNVRHDQIFGYDSLLPEWTYDNFLSHVLPEYRSAVDAKFRQAVASSEPLEYECRIRRADGALRWIWAKGRAYRDADGQPRRMIGTVADVTERKEIETELRDARSRLDAALEAGAVVTWVWDIPNNRLFSDDSLPRLFNLPPSDAKGGLLDRYIRSIHPDDWPSVSAALDRSVESGEDYEADYRIMQSDGSVRWVTARGSVERDGSGRPVRMPGVLVDITERKRAEEELRHRERVSRFLAEATTALASLTDYESTLRRVAEVSVPFFADWCLVDMAEADGVLRGLAVAHMDPDKVELIHDLRRRYPPRPTDPHGPQNVLRTGRPEMASDIPDALLAAVAQSEDHLHILRGLGLRSYICVPLVARGRILGVMTFVTATSGRAYDVEDLRLAEDLAHRVALAVENAMLYSTVQDALRQKEESLALLDTLQNNAPVGFAFVDRQFRYVCINEALAAIDGNIPEYHLGRTVQEAVPELWPSLEPLYRGVLENGEPVRNREVTGETPAAPGQVRHWLVNYYPVRVRGEVAGVGVLVADISEQKRAEEELRYRHELLRAITDTATTAIFMMDERSRCTFMNPAAEEMTGYSFREAEGQILHDLIHHTRPDGSPYPMPECPIDRALPEDSIVHNHEDLFVRKNGSLFPVLCNARPVVREGKPVGTVIEVRDITLQKQAEEALRESEAYFRDLTQNMPIVVWTNLPDGRVDFVNRRWLEMTGQALEYVRSAPEAWMAAVHPDDRQRATATYVEGIRSGAGFTMEARFRHAPDGEYRWHLNRAVPLRDVAGNVVKFLGTCTDIEDQKRLEAGLRDADRRKDEFLATLAHELRNPLAPIRNSLRILKMPGVDAATARKTHEMMERQVHHLVRLVDDLLDVSRVMRGKIELRREPVELAAIVARAVETAKPLIEAQGHELEMRLLSDSLILDADPVRLAQVVGNLLTNAAKYTEPNGHIWLNAWRDGDEVVLSVRDDGIGIAPEVLSQVFELFMQVDHSSTKAQGGLGIGLTLVKNLVEMHGGSVTVQSAGAGMGCEFVVRLPLLVRERRERLEGEKGQQPQEPARASGHRLMVVDDNEDAALSFAMLLRLKGHEVRVAHDGPSALELAATFRPQVVFLDIGMPRMDGYEVARRMRQQPGLENVMLAALTGWGQQQDRRRTAEAGFDHHLVKPPDLTAVESLLASLPKPNDRSG